MAAIKDANGPQAVGEIFEGHRHNIREAIRCAPLFPCAKLFASAKTGTESLWVSPFRAAFHFTRRRKVPSTILDSVVANLSKHLDLMLENGQRPY